MSKRLISSSRVAGRLEVGEDLLVVGIVRVGEDHRMDVTASGRAAEVGGDRLRRRQRALGIAAGGLGQRGHQGQRLLRMREVEDVVAGDSGRRGA